jgi:hypothetical protein
MTARSTRSAPAERDLATARGHLRHALRRVRGVAGRATSEIREYKLRQACESIELALRTLGGKP